MDTKPSQECLGMSIELSTELNPRQPPKTNLTPDLAGHLESGVNCNAPEHDNSEPAFSIFTKQQKSNIIVIVSVAALFSPLSANIYYPALPVLADDFNVSPALINLTITSYLIFQGLAPTLVGSFSDGRGRRPAYLICFTIYVVACIGLALVMKYPGLIVLRCLQSSGSSATVALANAVVADIVTTAERGSYMGYVSLGALLGPSIGPVIGGALCGQLGWRSTFWFLTIFGVSWLIVIAVFFPETCRNVVGNGAGYPQPWNFSLISYLALKKQRRTGELTGATRHTYKSRSNPLNSFKIMFDKESGILLLYTGLTYTGFYMNLAVLPTVLKDTYGLNTIQIGLCYIPSGLGSFLAAIVTGRILDWNFARHSRKVGMEVSGSRQQDLSNLPIERARLEITFPFAVAAGIFLIGFGWSMDYEVSLACPLVLNFCTTFCSSSCFQGISTLIVDLNRENAGAATATINFSRCLLGAGGTSLVVPMLSAVGIGWVSTIIAAVWLAFSPIVLLIIKRGPQWRSKKEQENKRVGEDKVSRKCNTVRET